MYGYFYANFSNLRMHTSILPQEHYHLVSINKDGEEDSKAELIMLPEINRHYAEKYDNFLS